MVGYQLNLNVQCVVSELIILPVLSSQRLPPILFSTLDWSSGVEKMISPLSADVAMKTAELLNAWVDGKYKKSSARQR
jgi:hypothetical protein